MRRSSPRLRVEPTKFILSVLKKGCHQTSLGTNAPESCQQHHKHLRCKGESTQTNNPRKSAANRSPCSSQRLEGLFGLISSPLSSSAARQLSYPYLLFASNSDPLS
ncbi:hypothetical protein PSTT_15262 [Puccinia striiformis]|uniref:Uncharacterized protein n=1 Tax=Puccinia striiformis TaxID=27350 RepID=A0A2S4UIK5_9BASI|nr:hypothetical protein PSTT_15262 [Puccinia striiformis]